ncbi:MAG TPA: ABC transporter ATP-binding protein [Candidatus Eremiobacteraeota bacterium]|nr:MAG: Oligopeptide transport ATP-binding protein OppD [bacterium ADurb.Bin363]HPZ09144.1 ABC transporter ATP-binding protein [Candidatus Eremiobacteraeota bacterium]
MTVQSEVKLAEKSEEKRELLIDVKKLHTYFYTDAGLVKSVNDVSYNIYKGETLGLVGESGCGKSVSAMSIMRLIPQPPGKIVEGEIIFEGKDLTKISEEEMRQIRGNEISVIFQEPMTSLNPVYTVGDQIQEAIALHLKLDYAQARTRTIEMLAKVGIPSPEIRVDDYPHQMSGGMKQRVMIAMALSCNPKLLIADEPTTALDVTIQAQILDLLRDLQAEYGMSILLITHDLGVIAEMAHRVVVMYASKCVEQADVCELFENPKHPYTVGLFNSLPKIHVEQKMLEPIPGMVPNPLDFPVGCKFNTRCVHVMDICKEKEPPYFEVAKNHWAACWLNER